MLLKSLTLSNYRSVGENVRIDLNKLTVFVGPNGSGKSNIMDALRFLGDVVHLGLSAAIMARQGIDAVRRWTAKRSFDMSIGIHFELAEGENGSYSFGIVGTKSDDYEVQYERAEITNDNEGCHFFISQGTWLEGPHDLRPQLNRRNLALPLVSGDLRFAKLFRALQSIAVYSIFPDKLREPQKYSPAKPMSRHGENWVSILRDQPENDWQTELVPLLYKLTGDIIGLKVVQVAGHLAVQFQHESTGKRKKFFGADQESDGTLRVAGIATALLQRPPVPVIGIEEPELTVHPGAIPLLYDYLVQAQKSSQVIVTTHSPELLDLVDPQDVRVVMRHEGVTSVARMRESQRQTVQERLMTLGDIMRTEGLQQQHLDFPDENK
jgi:predicted ATPase